jgi:hypothetical protein
VEVHGSGHPKFPGRYLLLDQETPSQPGVWSCMAATNGENAPKNPKRKTLKVVTEAKPTRAGRVHYLFHSNLSTAQLLIPRDFFPWAHRLKVADHAWPTVCIMTIWPTVINQALLGTSLFSTDFAFKPLSFPGFSSILFFTTIFSISLCRESHSFPNPVVLYRDSTCE